MRRVRRPLRDNVTEIPEATFVGFSVCIISPHHLLCHANKLFRHTILLYLTA
jgi:hypothetical protein